MAKILDIDIPKRLPPRNTCRKILSPPLFSSTIDFKLHKITDLFDPILRGDFHALDKLDKGDMPTVSRTSDNNGIVGYFEKPDGARTYQPGSLTVSTVTGMLPIIFSPTTALLHLPV
jgi:hypothetical protein